MATAAVRPNSSRSRCRAAVRSSAPLSRSGSTTKIDAAPGFVPPMLAMLGALPPAAEQENYSFEIKWDGVRAIALLDQGRLSLISRNRNDITEQYPELALLGEEMASRQLVLDGEIVALDERGRSSFSLLQTRMHVRDRIDAARRALAVPATYIIFDILFLDGRDTTRLPYGERRRLLERLELAGAAWATPPAFMGEGEAVMEACRHQKLEGVIVKRLQSPYQPGVRSRDWTKVKIRPRQELVVGGWTPGQNSRSDSIGALLVGHYDVTPEDAARRGRPQELIYAGKVGAGFTEPVLQSLRAQLTGLRRLTNPFSTPVPRTFESHFVEPVLVAEVEMAEWTHTGSVRQAAFKGVRDDKDADRVVREVETPGPETSTPKTAVPRATSRRATPTPTRSRK